jgi:hypothetical protein
MLVFALVDGAGFTLALLIMALLAGILPGTRRLTATAPHHIHSATGS